MSTAGAGAVAGAGAAAAVVVVVGERERENAHDGEGGQGEERVHEAGMGVAPAPGVHAAHRGPGDQQQVVDAEVLRQQPVLRRHHVVVVVAREIHPQAVARPAGGAVADAVGQHDEVLARVERAAGAEERLGEASALWHNVT